MHKAILVASLVIAVLLSFDLLAKADLKIAVASNFSTTANRLFNDFEAQNSIKVVPLVGSTGKHVAQIQNGLSVDIFLAADKKRPQWLVDNGLAIKESRVTYAIGRLVLFSTTHKVLSGNELLSMLPGARVAIANPLLAPYGVAAIEFLDNQNIRIKANPKIIKGESVAQAYQFVASGAVELALIAYSQVVQQASNNSVDGQFYLVPSNLHQPIEQQAIMIRQSSSATAFMDYLKSSAAIEIIRSSGYEIP